MLLESFDQELHEKALRKEGYDSGYVSGKSEERENGICQLVETLQELGLDRETVIAKLREKYSLSSAGAEEYVKQYWT